LSNRGQTIQEEFQKVASGEKEAGKENKTGIVETGKKKGGGRRWEEKRERKRNNHYQTNGSRSKLGDVWGGTKSPLDRKNVCGENRAEVKT